jgi:hypothetical protein
VIIKFITYFFIISSFFSIVALFMIQNLAFGAKEKKIEDIDKLRPKPLFKMSE